MEQQQVTPPSTAELHAFSLGKGEPQRATEIEAFLADGPDCTTILAAAPEDSLVRYLRGARELANGHYSPPRIPGYEVLGELGRGGMGVVYHARHLALNRPVALKMILAGGHAGPSELARFRQEAETVARLQHPNIVQVYEVGEHDGLPYLALEYVEGGNLAQKTAGAPQPAQAVAGLVELLARAVDYAHQTGVIHRDLKPANVLLTAAGAPKLSDFGLARWTDDAPGMTATGAIVGTPGYLAPEQAYAKPAAFGPATDVYGLGAILYYLLTGRPPFQAATAAAAVLHTVVDEPVPPTQLQPGVPRDLETICLKCLQKEPPRRYTTALALAEDLRRFQAGEPINARPVGRVERGWSWCRRNPVVTVLSAAALALLVAVAAVSVGYAVERGSAAQSLKFEKDETDRVAGELRIEKDRAQAALKQSRSNEALLTADRAIKICEEGEDGQAADVSRGLLWLARAVELAPEDDEKLQHLLRVNWTAWQSRLCPLMGTLSLPQGARASVVWSPDDQQVLAGSEQGLDIWDVRGWRKVRTLPTTGKQAAVAWSPNKRWVAASGEADGLVRIFNRDDGSFRTVKEAAVIHELAFSPDSSLLVAACHDEKVRFWDAETAEARGDPLSVGEEQVLWVAFDRDGGRFVTTTPTLIRQWDTLKRKAIDPPIHLPTGKGRFFCARYSPDGKRLSFCVTGDSPGGGTGVYIVAAQSPFDPKRRKVLRALARSAQVSPDGEHLLVGLDACRGAVYDLDRVGDPVFEDALFTITGHPRRMLTTTYAPRDGRAILTASNDGQVRLSALPNDSSLPPMALPLKDEPLHLLTEEFTAPGIRCLAVSPDGQWLFAGGWDRDGLLLGAVDGAVRGVIKGHEQVITAAAFTPDGKRLVTGSADGKVRLWDVATGGPLLEPWGGSEIIVYVAVSPDGSRAIVGTKTGGHVLRLDRLTEVERAVSSRRQQWNFGRAATFLPDGKGALIGQPFSADFWDMTQVKRTGRELNQTSAVSAVAVDAEGQWAATGAWGVGQIWDLQTGNPIGPPLLQKDDRFMRMAFSPDRRLLASLAFKKGVRFWDVATARAVGPVLRHPGDSNALVFQPDGSALLTSSTTSLVYRWTVPRPVKEDASRLMLRTQVLTGMELDGEGVVRVLGPDAWRERRQRLEELAPGTVPYFAPE